MNLSVGFRAVVSPLPGARIVLRLAASSLYRAFVNGAFLGHGPARGPHGHYRVDEWDLTGKLRAGDNVIAVEVAGYNVNSYYLLNEPAFLQAEIAADGAVLAATGGEGAGFAAMVLEQRLRKVQRYSFQRTFSEAYRLQPDCDRWRRDPGLDLRVAACAVAPDKRLIPRRLAQPKFALLAPVWDVAEGALRRDAPVAEPHRPRSLTRGGHDVDGFVEEELEVVPLLELQTVEEACRRLLDRPFRGSTPVSLPADSWRVLDFGTNLTGFLGATVTCTESVRLFFTFDEILTEGDVDLKRTECANIVSYELAPGRYEIESFEPYTVRGLKLIALDGGCEIEGLYLRELANPLADAAEFASSDRRLNRLFEAARETFRQNAVDIFMDCPSRERAGWLCDSFFTARVEQDLCGCVSIERNSFENYLLPPGFEHLPDGMLPMCYPADHPRGSFIPNWALWFVVQLEEYLARSGDRNMVDALKPKVMALFDYFAKFRNSDGLLEKLDSWVFLEWSKANEFVQDVNYPTNAVYAGALDAAGRLYGLRGLSDEAARVRENVRAQSFDGAFFVDNAVRDDGGRLRVTRNRTEACQYYVFFFDVATPETHPELWRTLTQDFGPKRQETSAFSEIHMANAFIGNYLRLELLSRHGLRAQLLGEVCGYFSEMAERTGTLWENMDVRASCNHGFASHVAHLLYRDVLGVRQADAPNGKVTVRLADLPLDWCRGKLPCRDGAVDLEWWREGEQVRCRALLTEGAFFRESQAVKVNAHQRGVPDVVPRNSQEHLGQCSGFIGGGVEPVEEEVPPFLIL